MPDTSPGSPPSTSSLALALADQASGVATYRPEFSLRTVSLRLPYEGWPAGTVGVIVEPFEHAALVEISGELGVTLAMLSIDYDDLIVMDEPVSLELSALPAC